jgi:arginase
LPDRSGPFSWLSERYGEGFGILWIDTHPDVMTPAQYANAHAHILGALMGNGDHDLTHRVKRPVPASNVMIAGLHSPNAYEADFIRERGIRTVSPEAIRAGSQAIAEWIKAEKITHLAIHLIWMCWTSGNSGGDVRPPGRYARKMGRGCQGN